MRNRAIQVKMVKADEASKESGLTVGHMAVMTETIAENVIAAVILYMVADTARQTILHIVRTKIN